MSPLKSAMLQNVKSFTFQIRDVYQYVYTNIPRSEILQIPGILNQTFSTCITVFLSVALSLSGGPKDTLEIFLYHNEVTAELFFH